VSIRCGWIDVRNDEECGALVKFDLTEPAWVDVTPEILDMMSHAESIEVLR
jgi:hypothetical protein